jgi:hypothetical protein
MSLSDEYHRFFTHFLDFLHESLDFGEIILYLLDALRLFNGVLIVVSVAPLIHLVLKL